MGWTIVQPHPSHIEARKVISSGYDISNFAFSKVNTAIEQPLQNEEVLSLPALYKVLTEVDRDNDNCFLMRGKPVGQNADLTYGLTESNWLDCSSKQFQFDLDEETDLLHQGASLDERVGVALEELPFLKNCRFIAQLSSSAGLGIVTKSKKEEDKSKKYCLRLWVETDKAYSCAELRHHLEPFSYLIDLSMYEPTRRHYIMRGSFPNTENLLVDKPHLRYYEGGALSLQEISGEIKDIARKKTKDSSLKEHKTPKKTGKAWKTLYSTNRKDLISELERDAKNGEVSGIRNDLFSELFRNEALFNSGDCALLIDEMLNAPALMGDRDEKNLQDWAKLSGKKALSILKLDAEKFRKSHFSSIHNFNEIDLAERDWSNILDDRAVAIRSCMGTNKTKGVIYDLVKRAKAEDKSVLIITPLVAVTLQIAEEVKIDHYHSFGTSPEQKKRVFAESNHLAVCYQSLGLYEEMGIVPDFDIVIIDEASQVFRAWTDPAQHLAGSTMVFNILDRSQNAIIMDADIDDELCLWGLSRIANFAPETSAIYYNSASYLENYEVALEDDFGRTLEKILNSVTEGKKVAIFTSYGDENGTLSAFGSWIHKWTGKKVKAFDSNAVTRTAPELKTHPDKTISSWIKDGELDCLVVSSWAACGWDYRVPGVDFDEVFILSTGGFFSAQKIKQMLRRMRMTRKASVYLNNSKKAAVKNEYFKAIKSEKGIDESDMNRMDAWSVRAIQANRTDLVNVPWLLRELLKEGGAIVDEVKSTEEEIESSWELHEDWKTWKKEQEEAFNDANRTPEAKTLRVLSNFQRACPHAFTELSLEDISPAQMKTLVKRDKKINSDTAQRFGRLISQDTEEREKGRDYEFNLLLGRLLDSLWFELEPFIDTETWLTFAHWYADPKSPPIYGNFDELDIGKLRLSKANLYALKQEFPAIGQDCWNEPNRLLRPIVQSMNLTFTSKTEMDKKDKDKKVSAKDAQANLFAHYTKSKEPGFSPKGKVTAKKTWCLENIKKKKGENLFKEESDFLQTRPQFFVIKRPEFVSTAWLYEMKRSKERLDDKAGFSENHTQYCSCERCQESKARRLAV